MSILGHKSHLPGQFCALVLKTARCHMAESLVESWSKSLGSMLEMCVGAQIPDRKEGWRRRDDGMTISDGKLLPSPHSASGEWMHPLMKLNHQKAFTLGTSILHKM